MIGLYLRPLIIEEPIAVKSLDLILSFIHVKRESWLRIAHFDIFIGHKSIVKLIIVIEYYWLVLLVLIEIYFRPLDLVVLLPDGLLYLALLVVASTLNLSRVFFAASSLSSIVIALERKALLYKCPSIFIWTK